MSRFVNPQPQYFSDLGLPLSEGNLFFYITGTNTPLDTYSDPTLSIPNDNPVPLDAGGRPENDIFIQGVYKVVLRDLDGNLIWEKDPVGGDVGSRLAFASWQAAVTYSINNVVTGSDGNYYVSLVNNNLNNDPVSSPASWERVEFIRYWNANVTYAASDIVQDVSGFLWRSLQGSNTGNTPSDSQWWSGVSDIRLYSAAATYGLGQVVRSSTGLLYRSLQAANTGNALVDGAWWSSDLSATWAVITATGTVYPNAEYQVLATVGATDLTLGTFTTGDQFTIRNSLDTTQTVTVLNPSYTIKGPVSSASAGTDVTIAPGQTMVLVAQSASILEVANA